MNQKIEKQKIQERELLQLSQTEENKEGESRERTRATIETINITKFKTPTTYQVGVSYGMEVSLEGTSEGTQEEKITERPIYFLNLNPRRRTKRKVLNIGQTNVKSKLASADRER